MQPPTHTCLNCRKHFPQQSTTVYDEEPPRVVWHDNTVCSDCHHTALFSRLAGEVQEQADGMIYTRRILEGMTLFRRNLGIGLPDALDLYHWRYDQLRAEKPLPFICPHSHYWYGFYS